MYCQNDNLWKFCNLKRSDYRVKSRSLWGAENLQRACSLIKVRSSVFAHKSSNIPEYLQTTLLLYSIFLCLIYSSCPMGGRQLFQFINRNIITQTGTMVCVHGSHMFEAVGQHPMQLAPLRARSHVERLKPTSGFLS